MIKVGITGQAGFVGRHLYNALGLSPETYTRIAFKKEYFSVDSLIDAFVMECDIIVHLAGLNRHSEESAIYDTNVGLAVKLVDSFKRVAFVMLRPITKAPPVKRIFAKYCFTFKN